MAPKELFMPKIALLIQGVRNYERELLSGIAEYSNLHGPWQFYRNVSYLPEEKDTPSDLIRKWAPNALIVRESSPHIFDEVLGLDIPIIYSPATQYRPGLSHIIVDDYQAGRIAARHLHEIGCRSFAFSGISELFFWSRHRQQGFIEQVKEFGHEVHLFESPQGDEFLGWSSDSSKLQTWLKSLPDRTGIMACNDDFALLIQEACIAIGRSIPDEIALIGVGNDESIFKLTSTPLSSIELNLKKAGYEAAKQLAEMMKGKPVRNDIVIEPLRVVARRSTDPNETHDPEVARAISYITEHINYPIGVDDVVAQVSLSRRGLYTRFDSATGKSISAFIRDRRLDHFSKLLLGTDLTVSEIAYSMGYDSDTNVARLFKKQFGMTPMAFRKKHRP
ncbi:MAG: substrate-binding domain-containing protein [Opitutales bacterium]